MSSPARLWNRRTAISAALAAIGASAQRAPGKSIRRSTSAPLRASPSTLPPPTGFSHIAEARGRLIYISGQVPHNPAGELIGEGDFTAQLQQVFHNLGVAVKEAGGRFSDIVKLNYYCHASVERALLREVPRIRDRYVDTAHPPASTFIFVAGLVRPSWLIEVDAVLAIPEA